MNAASLQLTRILFDFFLGGGHCWQRACGINAMIWRHRAHAHTHTWAVWMHRYLLVAMTTLASPPDNTCIIIGEFLSCMHWFNAYIEVPLRGNILLWSVPLNFHVCQFWFACMHSAKQAILHIYDGHHVRSIWFKMIKKELVSKKSCCNNIRQRQQYRQLDYAYVLLQVNDLKWRIKPVARQNRDCMQMIWIWLCKCQTVDSQSVNQIKFIRFKYNHFHKCK